MHRSLALLLAAALSLLANACATTAPLPPKAVELNRDGAAALASGDLGTAEARLQLALEYNPRFVEAWTNLGLVALRQGNFPLAHKRLAKARSLNPDLPAPHHGLGLLADARGEGIEAEKHYRAALKVDPGFAPARANLARRLYARGAFEEAREQYLRLTEVAPETVQGFSGLVECLWRLGREAEGDEVLSRAREGFGDVPDVQLLVGRQALRGGRLSDAEAAFAPLTHDASASLRGAAWAWTAVARLAAGDATSAVACANQALLVDRDDPVAHYAMGMALLAQGDTARGHQYLARASAAPQSRDAVAAAVAKVRR
jgi:tetratricopeptide (TPR) repeat protein